MRQAAMTTAGAEDALERAVLLDMFGGFPTTLLRVTGSCMEPALRAGETVRLAGRDRVRPRVGDVVLTRQPQGLRLHRVVWRSPDGAAWRTQSDHAAALDGALADADVLATVVGVEDDPGRRVRWPTRSLRSLARTSARWLLRRLPGRR
jgi:hypothetical protein